MSSEPLIPAVFVSSRNSLAPAAGGVQLYTRELLETLRLAGFDNHVVDYQTDMSPLVRLRRRLRPRPYADRLRPELAPEIVARQRQTQSRFIFLSGVELGAVAKRVRAGLDPSSNVRLVLFSYGLDSVDYLHMARSNGLLQSDAAALKLGRQFFAECEQRHFFDHVFCLAPFEAEIERWLGARRVGWLPRTIPSGQTLDWQPDPMRLGCVSTVDHPPNREGLRLFLEEFDRIAPAGVRFRLVGGPLESGRELTRHFKSVDFLGPLDDDTLRAEASRWSCFVHPIFCYAMGCSTKLAVALGWRLPVATTAAGTRGYRWREGTIPVAETPAELARLVVSMLRPEAARAARHKVDVVAGSCPTLPEVAAELRDTLLDGSAAI